MGGCTSVSLTFCPHRGSWNGFGGIELGRQVHNDTAMLGCFEVSGRKFDVPAMVRTGGDGLYEHDAQFQSHVCPSLSRLSDSEHDRGNNEGC